MWKIACRGSGFRRTGIVKEPLAKNLIVAPLLHGDLVDAVYPARKAGQLEYPVDRDPVALDHRGRRFGIDLGCPRENAALMRNQPVAADPRRRGVLLHAGVFGVIALDGVGMVAALDDGNELHREGLATASKSPQMLGSGNSSTGCSLRRRFANEAKVSTASPNATGGDNTRMTPHPP